MLNSFKENYFLNAINHEIITKQNKTKQNKTKQNILWLLLSLLVILSCQKENELLRVSEDLTGFEQNKTIQSHLRANDIPFILDFVNKETNNTRQVLIDNKSIKKAKQDYRNARMESGFGYIETSNALLVEGENVNSYTFKVVTNDLSNFINYIVVEDKATLELYSYFIKYTPTEAWKDNNLSLTSFSGTIDYFNEDEELQTSLTLTDGYITDLGETDIPCPEIIFNTTDATTEEDDSSSTTNGTGGGGGSINNDDGTSYNYNPWETWWPNWIATGGGGNGGDDGTTTDQEFSSDCTPSSCVKCKNELGKPCNCSCHGNRYAQLDLRSQPSVENPCVHTGVVAFLMAQLQFSPEQVDWITDIEQADIYESMINYLNINDYSLQSVTFANEAVEAGINGGHVDFEEEVIVTDDFMNHDCLYNVYTDMGKAPAFENYLQNFESDASVAYLKFSVEIILVQMQIKSITMQWPSQMHLKLLI